MKKRFALLVAVLTLVLSDMRDATGQWVRSNWPDWPARCSASSFVVNGTNLFAGTSGVCGIFLSTDTGVSWVVVDSGLPFLDNQFDVDAFAQVGTNLFAGGYQGIYLSTNNGISWAQVDSGLQTVPFVEALAVIGTNLFDGAYGHGVFRTTNFGSQWTAANNGLTSPFVLSLAVSGNNLFAGTADSGVYLSTDTGNNWIRVSNGLQLPQGGYGTLPIAVNGTNLFIGIEGTPYLSTNNGSSWTPATNGLPLNNFVILALATSGTNLFLGGNAGFVYLSTDSGKSWIKENSGLPGAFIQSLQVMGTNLFAATQDSGVWRRPLSEMISSSAVEPGPLISSAIAAYPNPFTQSTTISFTTPESGVATVAIVNILGAIVARIFSGELDAGTHSFMWDKPTGLPTGMYECIVQMNGRVSRAAMVVN